MHFTTERVIAIWFIAFWITNSIFIITGIYKKDPKDSQSDHAFHCILIFICSVSLVIPLCVLGYDILFKPAHLIEKFINEHKCISCDKRLPYESCYCAGCGAKQEQI